MGGGPPGGRLAAARGTHIVKVESKDACKQKGSGEGVRRGGRKQVAARAAAASPGCLLRATITHHTWLLCPRAPGAPEGA